MANLASILTHLTISLWAEIFAMCGSKVLVCVCQIWLIKPSCSEPERAFTKTKSSRVRHLGPLAAILATLTKSVSESFLYDHFCVSKITDMFLICYKTALDAKVSLTDKDPPHGHVEGVGAEGAVHGVEHAGEAQAEQAHQEQVLKHRENPGDNQKLLSSS